jgi:hypothetical protein
MEHNQSNFGLDQCHDCGVRRKQVANPTTNYGFVLPTPTDLVTDLPADFDVALQGVDTRLKALQPGTTLGDLAYSSATANTNTRLGIGTTGQVLSVSGGVPAWTTPATGGGMTLLASGTISGTVNLTSIAQTYEELVVYVWDYTAAGANELKFRLNGDTGANYGILRLSGTNTTSTTEMRNADTSIIVVANDTAANATNNHCVFTIPNYTAPAFKLATSIAGSTAFSTNENQIRQLTACYRSATAVDQIELVGCTAGNYELWGVK